MGAQSVAINGSVGRSLLVGGDSVTVAGNVAGEIRAGANTLALTDSARVGGDVLYSSDNTASVAGSAVIGGNLKKSDVDFDFNAARFTSAARFIFYVSSLVTGLILMWIFRRSWQSITGYLDKHSIYPVLGWGSVGLIAAIPIAVVLMTTLVGIPSGILLLGGWLIGLYISRLVAGSVLGRFVLRGIRGNKDEPSYYLSFIVGYTLYAIAVYLPYIGGLIRLGAFVIGFGLVLKHLAVRLASPRQA